jgi:ABC-type antimicrobial peptide transport system ATPase subunit
MRNAHGQQYDAGWPTIPGDEALQSIRRVGTALIAWLRGDTSASDAARRARAAQAYDAQIIRRAVALNSPDEVDWLLCASIITDEAKRRFCIERALTINPGSAVAAEALARLHDAPSSPRA